MEDDDDKRFSRFSTDPKFRTVSRKEKKVSIDGRFKSMFKDDRFVSKTKVDKRGRPTSFSSKENFRKYYNLSRESDDEDEDDEDEDDVDILGSRVRGGRLEVEEDDGDSSDSSEEEEGRPVGEPQIAVANEELAAPSSSTAAKFACKSKIRDKLQDLTVDYARGEGVLDSSSSSSSEEEEEDEEEEAEEEDQVQFDKWGELDHDADRGEEITRRLAVCNMDWDRVGADDIFIVMSSFCPVGGHVVNVRVFLSDFGRARLAEEEKMGPEELRRSKQGGNDKEDSSSDGGGGDGDEEEVDKKAMERIRRYQVNRLKYYYAVAEFDCAKSANKVYEECDGTEYELSATRFDLRFIPDDMTFSEPATSACAAMPDASKYKPKFFMTTALQQGKVDLTWDETDPNRLSAMKRAFERDGDLEDARAYIATDSEEEVEEEEGHEEEDDDQEEAISKYKALLSDISAKEKRKEEERGNMEVTFGSSRAVEEERKKKVEEKMSPWEKYLHKKKEKRSAKREDRKQKSGKEEEESGGADAFSDDELPDGLDFSDPFFQSELGEEESPAVGQSKKKKGRKGDKKAKGKREEEEENERDGELSLLVMDSDDDKGHFDYKEIVKQEGKSKKSKKKQQRKGEKSVADSADSFRLDLQDNRFAAVFENAAFNVDPSHPSFKKTKSMQDIITEKQRRILAQDDEEGDDMRGEPRKKRQKQQQAPVESSSSSGKTVQGDRLDCLVKAVQKKTSMKKKK